MPSSLLNEALVGGLRLYLRKKILSFKAASTGLTSIFCTTHEWDKSKITLPSIAKFSFVFRHRFWLEFFSNSSVYSSNSASANDSNALIRSRIV